MLRKYFKFWTLIHVLFYFIALITQTSKRYGLNGRVMSSKASGASYIPLLRHLITDWLVSAVNAQVYLSENIGSLIIR